MTIDQAKKVGLLLFDVPGLSPFLRHEGGNNYSIELIFEGKSYTIQKERY